MKKKFDDSKYSHRAEQIGKNVIKKSRSASKYTSYGITFLENFVKTLLSIRPKQVEIKKDKEKGGKV